MVGEHGRSGRSRGGAPQQAVEVVAIKDVVAQHQHTRRSADKSATENERLRQTIRPWLHTVTQAHSPLTAVTKQALEPWRVLRCADQQNIADSSKHQRAQRVIHHRLVVNRKQLLAYCKCGWVQACTATSCENDAFPIHLLLFQYSVRQVRSLPEDVGSRSCQFGKHKEKARSNFSQPRRELIGRRAGCG